jgi:hypothetical protein
LLPEPCRAMSVGFILPELRGYGLGVMYVGFDIVKSDVGRLEGRPPRCCVRGYFLLNMYRRDGFQALLLSP